jgi:hypothetical protein
MVIFESDANQTILDSIPSPRAIQVFSVCITHVNLIASVGTVNILLGHHFTYEDSFLVYQPQVPLTHILEYIVELVMIFVGMP